MSTYDQFYTLGQQAHANDLPVAPAMSAEVHAALVGLPVGSDKGSAVLHGYSDGWQAANMAMEVSA